MELGNRILFVGDSITEWGRDGSPTDIGTGYVKFVHDYLKVTYPSKRYEIINRGVGGDRIIDLQARWERDVIELTPDVVSISIGINDVWRQLDHPELKQVTPQSFESIYRELIKQIKVKIEASHIILMEPTVIEEDVNSKGNIMLKDYVQIIHRLADEFEATIVPTHQAFIDYLEVNNNYSLTTDGVHMNQTGNILMAKTWVEAVGHVR